MVANLLSKTVPAALKPVRIRMNFTALFPLQDPYHQAYSGIFAAGSDEYGQFCFPGEFVSQFPLSDSGGQAPIYLLNQSLLC
jgi:hypothetical protein